MRRRLVIFARAPALGRVKSRLAAGIGAAAALRFYRAALHALVRRVGRDPRWDTVLAVTPDGAARHPRRWPRALPRVAQGGGDLGARMARALRAARRGPAVIVGADIPEISVAHIARAFRALGTADVVLGPARDGGYWLIGLRRGPLPARLFARVRWSTAHALADTRANLRGRRVALIDTLDDVDDVAGFRRWRERCGVRS